MSREELSEAAELLEEAAEATAGEPGEKLLNQARQLAELAANRRGPDHGRLARHQQVLRDVKPDVSEWAADRIDRANSLVDEYRMTLEGV